MKVSGVPWSHIFWGLGLILIIRSYYDKQIGTYYTGNKLSTFADTLKEKIWFTTGGKGVSDKYHIQLAYNLSKFIIADNGCTIINRNENKENLITALSPGDLVTITYESSYKDLINDSRNTIKILGLSGTRFQILSPDEVRIADKKDIRNWNIGGIILIFFGGLAYYYRKKEKIKTVHNRQFWVSRGDE